MLVEIKSITLYNIPFPRQARVCILMMVLLYLFSNYILNEFNRPQGMMEEIYFLAITAYVLLRGSEHFHCPYLSGLWKYSIEISRLKKRFSWFQKRTPWNNPGVRLLMQGEAGCHGTQARDSIRMKRPFWCQQNFHKIRDVSINHQWADKIFSRNGQNRLPSARERDF